VRRAKAQLCSCDGYQVRTAAKTPQLCGSDREPAARIDVTTPQLCGSARRGRAYIRWYAGAASLIASPITWMRSALVEQGIPGGEPAMITTIPPTFTRPILSSCSSTWRTVASQTPSSLDSGPTRGRRRHFGLTGCRGGRVCGVARSHPAAAPSRLVRRAAGSGGRPRGRVAGPARCPRSRRGRWSARPACGPG